MFTGLIEKTIEVSDFVETVDGAKLKIKNLFNSEVKLGDSIAINGVCLTVNEIIGDYLIFNVSKETLSISNDFKKGEIVNLERAMLNNSRFDGHLVYGHIDGTAKIKEIKNDGFSYIFEFETTKEISKYIVKKGSVAINGISLTIAEVINNIFAIAIIPHTYKNTNLSTLKKGDAINIETDIISRYIEKFLFLNKNDSKISMQMLKDNGFY